MDLAWDLRGTPAVQPVYQELGSRSPKTMIHPSDPDWERKSHEALKRAMGINSVGHHPEPHG
ncbi:MAG: hypothetical protein HC921_13760 [Synechococcaceae cyanobacterium SM2_3_1]|nr:hypothetical protein [Synechococcaceae cyanobacterium SM2_3_1]